MEKQIYKYITIELFIDSEYTNTVGIACCISNTPHADICKKLKLYSYRYKVNITNGITKAQDKFIEIYLKYINMLDIDKNASMIDYIIPAIMKNSLKHEILTFSLGFKTYE